MVEIGHQLLKNIAEDSDTEEDLPKAASAPLTPEEEEKVEEKVVEKEKKKKDKVEEKVVEKEKKKEKEEEVEEPFKENKEFSFQKFCSLHFQGDASHTHIYQRLRQPLLAHQDERDSLVRRNTNPRCAIILKIHTVLF